MKYDVKLGRTVPESLKRYPWIGVRNNQSVILFVAPNTGLKLRSGSDTEISPGTFASGLDETLFAPFVGTVTLSND